MRHPKYKTEVTCSSLVSVLVSLHSFFTCVRYPCIPVCLSAAALLAVYTTFCMCTALPTTAVAKHEWDLGLPTAYAKVKPCTIMPRKNTCSRQPAGPVLDLQNCYYTCYYLRATHKTVHRSTGVPLRLVVCCADLPHLCPDRLLPVWQALQIHSPRNKYRWLLPATHVFTDRHHLCWAPCLYTVPEHS